MQNNSIVMELQSKAMQRSSNISDLLRMALLVSTKLGIHEFREWIQKELGGYRGLEVPDYRIIHTTISAYPPRS